MVSEGKRNGMEGERYPKNVHRPIKEIDNLISRLIRIAITAWGKRIDTCPVFIPLMFPKGLRGAGIRQPVCAHIV
jgi:hypothetical protein